VRLTVTARPGALFAAIIVIERIAAVGTTDGPPADALVARRTRYQAVVFFLLMGVRCRLGVPLVVCGLRRAFLVESQLELYLRHRGDVLPRTGGRRRGAWGSGQVRVRLEDAPASGAADLLPNQLIRHA
jgi:hypothetical protein